MKRLYIKLEKERQSHIIDQLVHSVSVNIRISQPSKVMFTILGLTVPDVNLKRMHQLYNTVLLNTASDVNIVIWIFIRNHNI